MRLTDLHPQFLDSGGDGIFNADATPATLRVGVGVLCDCPCGQCDEYHALYVPFVNPIDGGPPLEQGHPTWQREGDTFETLTLTPSILRTRSKGGCGWHGFITNGDVTGRVE